VSVAQVKHKLVDNLKLFHELAGPVFGPGTQVRSLVGVCLWYSNYCMPCTQCLAPLGCNALHSPMPQQHTNTTCFDTLCCAPPTFVQG
jgi:hypothetical protein